MLNKDVPTKHGNNVNRFPDYTRSWTNLKKLYTVVTYQIYSAMDYLWHFRDGYRFYGTKKPISNSYRNFPSRYPVTDGASDKDLIRLARSFNIQEDTFSRIFFEWESKFTYRTTVSGIENFIQIFFKYELIDKLLSEEEAADIASQIKVETKSWYDIDITEADNVYFFDDINVLSLYLEVYIPIEHSRYFVNVRDRLNKLIRTVGDFGEDEKAIVPSSNFKRIEIIWR